MLKVNLDSLVVGTRVYLPEAWHEKVLIFSQKESFPYDFTIEEIVKEGKNSDTLYICVSDKTETGAVCRIAISEFVLMYMFAEEVPDSNIGLYFNEYLPLEDSKIIITNIRDPSEVVPVVIEVRADLCEIHGESMICLNFILNFLNGVGFTSIKHYSKESHKYVWKFLMHPDISYMTDYEKIFQDTIVHKDYVLKSCEKLANYLDRVGACEHAKQLRARALVHDNSKICNEDEMRALSRIINDKTSLKDPTKQLSPIKKDAIKLHWKHNSHHPEHFKTPIDMSKLDIMEMCCDWHARSVQYGSDFLSFVRLRQEDRFHFPEWMFAEIWHYCEVLASDV